MVQIVCTIGPSTFNILDQIKDINIGLIRINGSFLVPEISQVKKLGYPILVDIPGKRMKNKNQMLSDEELVEMAINNQVDYIGLSYLKSADEVNKMREYIQSRNSSTKIVGKIETKDALDNADSIIRACDMVLIDRGDLGTAIGYEKVPFYQQLIIRKCNELNKKIIVATEMLMSTIKKEKPSCSDVTDIFFAVMSGCDYVMLSEESAIGENPVNSLRVMSKIIEFTLSKK